LDTYLNCHTFKININYFRVINIFYIEQLKKKISRIKTTNITFFWIKKFYTTYKPLKHILNLIHAKSLDTLTIKYYTYYHEISLLHILTIISIII